MQVVLNLILSPINLFKVLFTNTTSDVAYDYIQVGISYYCFGVRWNTFPFKTTLPFHLIIYMLKMILMTTTFGESTTSIPLSLFQY